MVRATALLSHAITLAPVVALVPLKVALPFQAAAPSNGMNTQAPLLAPRAALKVRVNDPAAPGAPVPVVRTTAPTESVLPAPMAQVFEDHAGQGRGRLGPHLGAQLEDHDQVLGPGLGEVDVGAG